MNPDDPARRDCSLSGVLLMVAAATCSTALGASARPDEHAATSVLAPLSYARLVGATLPG